MPAQHQIFLRIALATGALLLIPLIAMQFTAEVNWGSGDFLVMGALIFAFASCFVVVSRRFPGKRRPLVAGAFVLVFLLIWAALANGTAVADEQRVILVTGSTGGLGRETALALARGGDHVIIHGRNEERAQQVLDAIAADGRGSAGFYKADLASLEQTNALADSILADYERLDVLVSNAGVLIPDQQQRVVTDDGFEIHFQVNYLAGYVLTARLLPLLEKSAPSRVIHVASGQRPLDFDDLMFEQDYDGIQAYFRSKNAQIMMTFATADELAARGITTNAMFPSALMNTDMVVEAGFEPQSSVETGRDALLQLINDDVGTGKFFNIFEADDVIPQAYDKHAQATLMRASEELTSIPFPVSE